MEEKTINAVELTRNIRDDHARQLEGASHAQRIAFYRERAKKMHKKVTAWIPAVKGKAVHPSKAASAVAVHEEHGTYKIKTKSKEKKK